MKIALGQVNINWFNIKANMSACINLIKRAHNKNCDIIFFPELVLTGFSGDYPKINEVLSYKEALDFFIEEAIKNDINIGFGALKEKNNKFYNSYNVISSKGELMESYDKLHAFSPGGEGSYMEPGEKTPLTRVRDINISTFICYDLRFPEIFQEASEKAHLITVAAAWSSERREHWLTLLKARAIETQCYIAGINSFGTDLQGEYYGGDSIIINPWGEVLSTIWGEEGLVIADISPEEVKKIRAGFPVKNDRRMSLYKKYYIERAGD